MANIEQRSAVMARPPANDLWLLGVAVIAISTSGPLIAATTAPIVAIAGWRCVLAAGLTSPLVFLRRRQELSRANLRISLNAVGAGLALAVHFVLWMSSLRYTSVASSTALVAVQPVWAAILARRAGGLVPRRAWVGIWIAIAGVVVISGVDFSVSGRALFGDSLALAGGVLSAVYVSVGERVRQELSTSTYTLLAYSSAAAVLFAGALVTGVQLWGYSSSDWWKILGLTLGAQLLGHTLIGRVLSTTSATVTSLAILLEMPGATLVAAVWLRQLPPLALLPAAALLFSGLWLVISSGDRQVLLESPPG